MTEAGWIVSGKRRQINARCGGLPEKSAEVPPFPPQTAGARRGSWAGREGVSLAGGPGEASEK